jgi:hypothetical protein
MERGAYLGPDFPFWPTPNYLRTAQTPAPFPLALASLAGGPTSSVVVTPLLVHSVRVVGRCATDPLASLRNSIASRLCH